MRNGKGMRFAMALLCALVAPLSLAGNPDREALEQEGVLEAYWPQAARVQISGKSYGVTENAAETLRKLPGGTPIYYGVEQGQVFGVMPQPTLKKPWSRGK